MVIDHIAIVVGSLTQGIRQWQELFGYVQDSDIVTNTRQKVRVVFITKKDSVTVKLLEPTGPDSSVFSLAKKGGGFHHICFRCKSLATQIPLLKDRGARLLIPPEPGEAFLNHDIAFMFAGNLNVELIDTAEKVGRKDDPGAPRNRQVSR